MRTVTESFGAQDTFELGRRMAAEAVPGTVIALDGELGTGKTVFAQGFAAGLGIREPVNSPTFTLLQVYEDARLPLCHMDLYRLEEAEELEEIGAEEYFYGDGVCLVEWGSLFPEALPPETVFVTIEKNLEKGTDYRRITCEQKAQAYENYRD